MTNDLLRALNVLCHVRNYLSQMQSESTTNESFIGLCDAQRIVAKRISIVARKRQRQLGIEGVKYEHQ